MTSEQDLILNDVTATSLSLLLLLMMMILM